MQISIIQPSRNNLKYLKWSYNAIRRNQGDHTVEICVADDFSDKDGTWDWCLDMMENDPLFKAIRNEGPTRLGHTILYDRLVNEVASFDVCMIYHADMYLCPGALDQIEKHIGPKKIISLTRIEPPLHPPGPEKILLDCGIEPEQFDEDKLLHHLEMEYDILHEGKTTEGIFAPWAFMKSDFQEIGGHDPLYAPQSKEDSDIFNRFQLNGVQFIQTWEGYVYHMTCRGSRFNPELTTPGKNSPEWEAQNLRSTRNFIRKWGHFCKHDSLMKPIIPSKYSIAFRVENCNQSLLEILEPWCDRIYSDAEWMKYITLEQPKTLFDLRKRCHSLTDADRYDYDDIVVEINGQRFTNQDFAYIQQLSEILDASDLLNEFSQPGEQFELGNLKITIMSVQTYEKNLIKTKQ
jgi:glycosyltransferase involved in cell wall biosynthesis